MKRAIVIFGGSFNPPTNSHLSLAEQIYDYFKEVERVVFMPVADCYPKKDLLEADYRVEMLKLVCEKNSHFELSTFEVEARKPLNTIETLRAMKQQYPDHDIWFMMGTDNLKLIDSWPGHRELLKEFTCLVLERGKDQLEMIVEEKVFLKQNKSHLIKLQECIHSDGSSTLIRERLRAGKTIRYMLPDEVYNYVMEKGLYTIPHC